LLSPAIVVQFVVQAVRLSEHISYLGTNQKNTKQKIWFAFVQIVTNELI